MADKSYRLRDICIEGKSEEFVIVPCDATPEERGIIKIEGGRANMIDNDILAELVGERIVGVRSTKRIAGLGDEITLTLESGRKVVMCTSHELDFKVKERDGREAKSQRQLEEDRRKCNEEHEAYGQYFESLDYYKERPVASYRFPKFRVAGCETGRTTYKAKGKKVPQPKYLVTDEAGKHPIDLDEIQTITDDSWRLRVAKNQEDTRHKNDRLKKSNYIYMHDLDWGQPEIPVDTLKLISKLRDEGQPLRGFFVRCDGDFPNFMLVEAYNKSDAVIRWAITTHNFNGDLDVINRTLEGRLIQVFNLRELKVYERNHRRWD